MILFKAPLEAFREWKEVIDLWLVHKTNAMMWNHKTTTPSPIKHLFSANFQGTGHLVWQCHLNRWLKSLNLPPPHPPMSVYITLLNKVVMEAVMWVQEDNLSASFYGNLCLCMTLYRSPEITQAEDLGQNVARLHEAVVANSYTCLFQSRRWSFEM